MMSPHAEAISLVPLPTTDAARRTYAARLANATKRLQRLHAEQAAATKAATARVRAVSSTLPGGLAVALRAESTVLRRVARALLTLPSDARQRVLDMARSHLLSE